MNNIITQEDLAARPVLTGIPIALSRVDGHALWVSQAALDIAERALPDERWPGPGEVEGGEVVKDDKGEPTGTQPTTSCVGHHRTDTNCNE